MLATSREYSSCIISWHMQALRRFEQQKQDEELARSFARKMALNQDGDTDA